MTKWILQSCRAVRLRACSPVSAGTERAMIDVAQESLLGKALARPDWAKQVVDKVRTEGITEAYRQSRARLDMPLPLGTHRPASSSMWVPA